MNSALPILGWGALIVVLAVLAYIGSHVEIQSMEDSARQRASHD